MSGLPLFENRRARRSRVRARPTRAVQRVSSGDVHAGRMGCPVQRVTPPDGQWRAVDGQFDGQLGQGLTAATRSYRRARAGRGRGPAGQGHYAGGTHILVTATSGPASTTIGRTLRPRRLQKPSSRRRSAFAKLSAPGTSDMAAKLGHLPVRTPRRHGCAAHRGERAHRTCSHRSPRPPLWDISSGR